MLTDRWRRAAVGAAAGPVGPPRGWPLAHLPAAWAMVAAPTNTQDRPLSSETATWTLDQIRDHIAQGIPLVPLFNIDVIEASASRGAVRLREGEHITRPGGSIAGPVHFALADVAAYALILADRQDTHAVTVDLTINFLRPAMKLPLIAVATPLRAGRRLYTTDIRISEESTGRLVSQATATYALSQTE